MSPLSSPRVVFSADPVPPGAFMMPTNAADVHPGKRKSENSKEGAAKTWLAMRCVEASNAAGRVDEVFRRAKVMGRSAAENIHSGITNGTQVHLFGLVWFLVC